MEAKFIGKAKLTKQGQLTLPREARKDLGIGAESGVYWYEFNDALILVKELVNPKESVHIESSFEEEKQTYIESSTATKPQVYIEELPKIPVYRVVKAIQPFVGPDLSIYELKEGDIREFSKPLNELLLKEGVIEEIKNA